MEFMVAVSSGAGSGFGQGLLSYFGPTSLSAPSVTPPSPLRGAPLRPTLGAGAVLGGPPTATANAVVEEGGGTVATFSTPDLDDNGDDDPLASSLTPSHDLEHGAVSPASSAPAAAYFRSSGSLTGTADRVQL